MKQLFQYVKVPILLLVFILIVELLSRVGVIPGANVIIKFINESTLKYGLLFVGPISFIENISGINVYFPGSLAILTVMASTGGNPTKGVITYLTIYGFAFLAYHVNFYIGKRISDKERIRAVNKDNQFHLWIQFLTTFWHPHFAAITCIRMGGLGYQYNDIFRFLLVSSFLWNTFWAVLMYKLGTFFNPADNADYIKFLTYIYLFILLLLGFYRYWTNKKRPD